MTRRSPRDLAQFEAESAWLRRRLRDLLKTLQLPNDALPGSLAVTHSRCGNPNCHCAQGKGHPGWQLTFMVEGRKRVERVPAEWADEVKQRVDAGRAFKETLAEILSANAELLVLARKQRRQRSEPIGRAPSSATKEGA